MKKRNEYWFWSDIKARLILTFSQTVFQFRPKRTNGWLDRKHFYGRLEHVTNKFAMNITMAGE